jgi:hypothetical protein
VGSLGAPVPRGAPHLATGETRVRWVVRAGGLTFVLRDSRKELYPPCTMTSNNADWEKGWFYLRNDGAGLPPTWRTNYRCGK